MDAQPPRPPEEILSEIFGVQVPPTTPKAVKQRLFTLAARDNADKVIGHQDVCALLEAVGAIVPRATASGHLECLGVLWAKDNPVCRQCEVNQTCQALAVSYGLDSIKISPRLLGVKIARLPKMFPSPSADSKQGVPESAPTCLVYPTSDRDLELLEWLNDSLRSTLRHGEIHYNIQGTNHYPISVGKPNGLMQIKICGPSPELQRLLAAKAANPPCKPYWTIDEKATLDEAISLINSHIASLLETHEPSHT